MLTAGHLLGNRYRLDERIATGGMGEVWRGTDAVLGRVVAVKVLRSAMMSDSEFAARFYGEARILAAFRHPGVVEVYDYASGDTSGDDGQAAYLVMAYVEGEPLSHRLKQGPLGVAETMSVVAQAADALHAAHQAGTVHRDVKPGNLIVRPTGAVVLVDFGVARSNAVTSVTAVNAIVGTALYMAPEQVAKGKVTPATDIYALGAVAYHCLAGHPPFDGDNPLQVALRHLDDEPEPLPDHVPEDVRALIARAMAKQADDRFASAAEFAEAALAAAGPLDWQKLTGTMIVMPLSPATPLSPALPTEPIALPSSPAPTAPPSSRPVPRSHVALFVAVLSMSILAVALIASIWLRMHPTDASSQTPPTTPAVDPSQSAPELELSPTPTRTRTHVRPGGVYVSRSASSTASPSASADTPSADPSASSPPDSTVPPVTPDATTEPTGPPTPDPDGDHEASG